VQPGEYVRKGHALGVTEFSRQNDLLNTAENNVIFAFEQAQQSATPIALPPPPADLKGGFEKKAVPIAPPVPTVLSNPSSSNSRNLTALAAAQQRVDDLQGQ